jgi:putative two-component system response regulator
VTPGQSLPGRPRHRVLVVDDEPAVRGILTQMMRRQGHEVEEAGDGHEALAKIPLGFDLVLLDVDMPGLDGFRVAEEIRADALGQDLPIIVVTGCQDDHTWQRALEVGVSDLISKPVSRPQLELRSSGLLRLKRVSDTLFRHQDRLEQLVNERTAALRHALDEMAEAQRQMNAAHLDTVRRLVLAAELRDPETGAHVDRIGHLAGQLAERLGLARDRVALIRDAAPMHDVGKLGVPDAILFKAGPLTEAEWVIMRQHPRIGAAILEGSPSELVRLGGRIALRHHERWDGTGYPGGIAGEVIPIEARICAVADVFDALTVDRPYRAALPWERALAIMEADRGRQFDPTILDVFLAHWRDFAPRRQPPAARGLVTDTRRMVA